MENIETDSPIKKSDEDRLGRAEYAKSIAKLLLSLKSKKLEHGIVLGLYGEWGSGKTSFINLVKEQLVKEPSFITINTLDKRIDLFVDIILKSIIIILVLAFDFGNFLQNFSIIEKIMDNFYVLGEFMMRIPYILDAIVKAAISYYICKYFHFNWIKCTIKSFLHKFINRNSQQDFFSIIDFAPWNTTDEKSIIKDFFATLRKSVATIPNVELMQSLDKYIAKICFHFSNGLIQIENKQNILELKMVLEYELKKSDQIHYMFIDDIDRLSDSEIYLMLKIIKSLADLPNLVYIIPLDKQIVSNALNMYHKGFGDKFLDKIIQVPLDLPIAQEEHLKQFLYNELEKLLPLCKITDEKFDMNYKKYWSMSYASHFHSFFSNIRDIKRFINSFKLTFVPQIHNELNIIDFWLITAIKLITPELYTFIKENKDFLTRKISHSSNTGLSEEELQYYKSCLDKIFENIKLPLKNNLTHFLFTMFPVLFYVDRRIITYDSYSEKQTHRLGRICCKEHFDKYFTYDNNNEMFTNSYMQESIKLAENYDLFIKRLYELDEKSLLKKFLQKFSNYTDSDIPKENLINFIKALLEYGDTFKEYDDEFLGLDIYSTINNIMHNLLYNNPNAVEIIKTAFSVRKSIFPAISIAKLINRSVERKEQCSYATKELSDFCIDTILPEIKIWADNDINKISDESKPFNGSLMNHRHASAILYFWYMHGDQKALKDYSQTYNESDTNFLKFLSIFNHIVKSTSDDGVTTSYRISVKDIEPFISLDDLKNRINSLDTNNLTEAEKGTLSRVLKAIEHKDVDYYDDEDE